MRQIHAIFVRVITDVMKHQKQNQLVKQSFFVFVFNYTFTLFITEENQGSYPNQIGTWRQEMMYRLWQSAVY